MSSADASRDMVFSVDSLVVKHVCTEVFPVSLVTFSTSGCRSTIDVTGVTGVSNLTIVVSSRFGSVQRRSNSLNCSMSATSSFFTISFSVEEVIFLD